MKFSNTKLNVFVILKQNIIHHYLQLVGDPNHVNFFSTNSSYLHVFLLCQKHDPCLLYLGAMIMGMDIFIGHGYGSHTEIATTTLLYVDLRL